MAKSSYANKYVLRIISDQPRSFIEICKYYSNLGSFRSLYTLRINISIQLIELLAKGLISKSGVRRHYIYAITLKGISYLDSLKNTKVSKYIRSKEAKLCS